MRAAGIIALVLAGIAAPAQARCLLPSDLSRGILFEREATGQGTAILTGGVVEVDYTAANDDVTLIYRTDRGIFPAEIVEAYGPNAEAQAGERDEEYWRFATTPPPLTPGTQWTTTLTITAQGTLFGQHDDTEQALATYAADTPRQAQLGDCTYTVMSVSVRIERPGSTRRETYVYFPDLGFGLLTGVTERKTGAMARFGILSLAPAR